MTLVLTGLVLAARHSGRYGHTRGVMVFFPGLTYRSCLLDSLVYTEVTDPEVRRDIGPDRLSSCCWAQWQVRSHKGCHGILPGTDLQIVLA